MCCVLFGAAPAAAWKQSKVPKGDACLAWQPREISWSPASPTGGGLDEADVLATFRRSFGVWAEPSCSDLRFVETAAVDRVVGFFKGRSNENVMLFRDQRCVDVVPKDDPCLRNNSCADDYDCWDFMDSLIAVTTVTFTRCSGEILDADIEINSASFRFTTADGPKCTKENETGCIAMDLQNTMVHEIGHLIGLEHSPRKDAVMYANASAGETNKRNLADDDLKALCTIYPEGGDTRTCGGVFGTRDCEESQRRQTSESVTCASVGGGGNGWTLLLAGLVLAGVERLRACGRIAPQKRRAILPHALRAKGLFFDCFASGFAHRRRRAGQGRRRG